MMKLFDAALPSINNFLNEMKKMWGWLKDKFGISWQIVPVEMDEMMENGTPEQIARLTEAFLKMKKFDIAALQKAYEG